MRVVQSNLYSFAKLFSEYTILSTCAAQWSIKLSYGCRVVIVSLFCDFTEHIFLSIVNYQSRTTFSCGISMRILPKTLKVVVNFAKKLRCFNQKLRLLLQKLQLFLQNLRLFLPKLFCGEHRLWLTDNVGPLFFGRVLAKRRRAKVVVESYK